MAMQTLEETIARMKREIVDDVRQGLLPVNASTFSDLHDFVDANEYGGLTQSEVSAPIIAHFGGDDAAGAWPQGFMDFVGEAQQAIHDWISKGGLQIACEAEFGNEWLTNYGELLRDFKKLVSFTERHASLPDATVRAEFQKLRNRE